MPTGRTYALGRGVNWLTTSQRKDLDFIEEGIAPVEADIPRSQMFSKAGRVTLPPNLHRRLKNIMDAHSGPTPDAFKEAIREHEIDNQDEATRNVWIAMVEENGKPAWKLAEKAKSKRNLPAGLTVLILQVEESMGKNIVIRDRRQIST